MRSSVFRRKILATIQVVLLALLVTVALKIPGLLVEFDNYCLSLFYNVRELRGFGGKPSYPDNAIIIVAIDDHTLQALGQSVFTYPNYIELLKTVRKGGPKVVGLDALLTEGDNGQDVALAAELDNVALPYWLHRRQSEYDRHPSATARMMPTAVLEKSAAALGFMNLSYKRVGSRTQLVYETYAGELKFSFPLAVLTIFEGVKLGHIKVEESHIEIGPCKIPTEEGHSIWINYFLPKYFRPDSGQHQVSASDVLEGKLSPEIFRGRLVLIGRTDRDAPHRVETPVGMLAEVQVFANVLSTILKGQYIGKQSRAVSIAILFGLILFTCLIVMQLRAAYGIIVFAAEGVGIAYGGCVLFSWGNYVVDLPLLLVGIASAFVFMMIYVAYTRDEEVKALSVYIAPAVRRRIVDSSRRIPVEGERKELSILYADLRGFTALTHQIDPRATVSLLNEYFSVVVPIIAEEGHEGTVDKLMGDGTLAFFGDPLPFTDSPERAAGTALAIGEAFRKLREKWLSTGRLPRSKAPGDLLDIGMGIATGPVIVGNIGCASVRRMDYTAIGDPVNRASALQKIAERGQILLDQRSADLIGEAFEVRPLGQREMKGIAIEVYELVGTKPKAQAPQGKAAGQPAA